MIRIGLIDGALPADWPGLAKQRRFCEPDGAPLAETHARAMAETIRSYCEKSEFINAAVFSGRLSTSIEHVCQALNWFSEDPPDIVLCSFGTAKTSLDLSLLTARLLLANCLVVASSPARGETVYPAGTPGVVSVQGDARCAPFEFSKLDLPHAEFGACPFVQGYPDIRGASAAAAHVVGQMAADLCVKSELGKEPLKTAIKYFGRECRSAAE
ncbi:hypothetical protein [Roseibium sp.]|uniref:hypothetical protein n=1 Tax=Roseibium sp. TaxID=1936156 RepID=UPI003B51FAAF